MTNENPAQSGMPFSGNRLTAGTIIGSGTVSNEDESHGVSCLVEKRVPEFLTHGAARTPFLRYGDRVRIEMFNNEGEAPLGAIEQEIAPCPD
jgi:fumarylacetoacetate (FAA) hydrolase